MAYEVDGVTMIGFGAALLTTLAFLPQAIKVWRTRSTKDISLLTFITFCVGVVLWLSYGILTQDLPLIAANGATLVLAGTILVFKLRYK